MDSITPSARSPTFLRLPLELRRTIYSYLLPDLPIRADGNEQGSLREDGKSGGGLLRVNRQILHELYHDWFRSTTFELMVFMDRFKFLNTWVQPEDSVGIPSTLKDVETLHIKMTLWKCKTAYDAAAKHRGSETPEVIRDLVQLLSSENSSLKHLNITITYVHAINAVESEKTLLINAIDPLKDIRGLSKVHIKVFDPHLERRSGRHKRLYNEFIKHSRLGLDPLERYMMKPLISENVSKDVSVAETGSLA